MATCAGVLLTGVVRPAYNWDVIGYVAAAYHQDGLRGAALSQRTYGDLAKAAPPAKFKTLIEDDASGRAGPGFRFLTAPGYQHTVYSDPKALEEHVPLYAIRIAYVALMRALKVAGLGYVRSSYLISAVSATAAVVVLWELLAMAGASALMLPVIVLSTGFIELARLSTPDALATVLALLAVLMALKRSPWSLLVAALLPLARSDFVLLSALIAGVEALGGRRRLAVAALAAAAVLYLVTDRLMGGYGWLTTFNFTLIRLTPYPAELAPSHAAADYLKPYAAMVGDLIGHPHFILYALAGLALWAKRGALLAGGFPALVLVGLAFVVLHLLLFPAYMPRFFVFAAALAFAWLAGALSRRDPNAAPR